MICSSDKFCASASGRFQRRFVHICNDVRLGVPAMMTIGNRNLCKRAARPKMPMPRLQFMKPSNNPADQAVGGPD